jgi:hypothetical protein
MKLLKTLSAWWKGAQPTAYYHSHVLHFPNQKPFDNPDLRWPGFIGEFVAPIVASHPEMLYWFSFYTTSAKLRIYTADYETLRPQLEAMRDKLCLQDKGEEKNLTLEEDLGGGRFRGPNCKVAVKARGESVLRALKGASDLMVESVIQRADGYWEFEENGDPGMNPVSNHRFSVVHLFHNLMDSTARVFVFWDAQGQIGVLSQYYFADALNRKAIAPAAVQQHDILM